jgi:hypothetical protein
MSGRVVATATSHYGSQNELDLGGEIRPACEISRSACRHLLKARCQEAPTPVRVTREARWKAVGVYRLLKPGATSRQAVYELGLRCTPLGVPDLKTFDVKAKRSPIVRANQAHPVSCRDREPAFIAGVSESGTIFNSVSNEL